MLRTSHCSVISLLLLVIGYTLHAQPASEPGMVLYRSKCQRCHGRDGTRGLFGAANLQQTMLNDQELFTVISGGRKAMPSWKQQLRPEQIRTLVSYVRTLQTIPSKHP